MRTVARFIQSKSPTLERRNNIPFFLHFSSRAAGGLSQFQDVETVYRIITGSTSRKTLQRSLHESGIPLSNDLVDNVLKRFRFGHGNPLQALEFFRFIGNRGQFHHTAFSTDTMLYVLGRSRKFDLMWDVLKEIRRKDPSLITGRTIDIVLCKIAKICSVRMTVECFWRFKKLAPLWDTGCFNALLRSLCREKSMGDAKNVYHALKKDFAPNLQTFNVLLSGWKTTAEAEAFFAEMKELGVRPDVVSYNSLIDAYCKSRDMGKASQTLEKMRDEEDISPDVITYTTIIGGLGLVGQPDKAREMLREMKEYGCHPDAAAYNAAIKNYCVARKLNDAYSLLHEMEKEDISPNATTYNLFLRGFNTSNDLQSAWCLYLRMVESGRLPNTQSCMFLIRLCKRHERADMALRLWNDMVEMGFGSYSLVSDQLFDLLCDMGMVVEAEECFVQMVEKCHKPSSVSFKRIKVLLHLAGMHESVQKLSNMMAGFESSPFTLPAGENVVAENV